MAVREYRSKDEVQAALADLRLRLPAHSVKPAMVEELEHLEDLLKSFQVSEGFEEKLK